MAGVNKLDLDNPAPILEDDEDEETLAAIDEGIRDAEAGRTVPIEDIRKLLPQWITTASSSRKANRGASAPQCRLRTDSLAPPLFAIL